MVQSASTNDARAAPREVGGANDVTVSNRVNLVDPVLHRESSSQLIMYSLDTCVRYSTYIPIFRSQKGSTEALNFLAITS